MLCDVLVVYCLYFMYHVFPSVMLIFVKVDKFPYGDNKGYGMVWYGVVDGKFTKI